MVRSSIAGVYTALGLSCAVALGPGGVAASETACDSCRADIYDIDFSVPDFTAFGLLGINPSEVVKPATLKEFSAGLMNFIGPNGTVQTGLAAEWAPLKHTSGTNLSSYRQDQWRNLQVSMGSLKEEQVARTALGVRWVPIDRSDPLMSVGLEKEINSALILYDDGPASAENRNRYLTKVRRALTMAGIPEDSAAARIPFMLVFSVTEFERLKADTSSAKAAKVASRLSTFNEAEVLEKIKAQFKRQSIDYESLPLDTRRAIGEAVSSYVLAARAILGDGDDRSAAVDRAIADAKKRFKKQSWNALILQLASGCTWRSENGTWQKMQGDTWSSFLGLGFPIGRYGQGILHLRYTDNLPSGAETNRSYAAGARMLVGSSDIHGTVEAAGTRTESTNPTLDKTKLELLGGLEIRLSSATWLELAVGGLVPEGSNLSQFISLGALKYGLSKESRYKDVLP